jgi:hypothetical protein
VIYSKFGESHIVLDAVDAVDAKTMFRMEGGG